jgi:hypothetical protein
MSSGATLLFIVLAAAVAAFVNKKKKDKCLKDFQGNTVTLHAVTGTTIRGSLRLEHTGLELVYPTLQKNTDGCDQASMIIYKQEYPNISALVRFHDDLSPANKIERQKQLKRTYHPKLSRRLMRRLINVFKSLRDSVMDLINLLIGQVKRSSPVGTVLGSQEKYVAQMKQELVGSFGTAFEPLLERYIGCKVILELVRGEKKVQYCGLLKDYTAGFVELMNVDYSLADDEPVRKADLVVLRQYGTVRHLAE